MTISTTNRVAGSMSPETLAILNLTIDQYIGKIAPSAALKRLAASKYALTDVSLIRSHLDKATKAMENVRTALAAKVTEHTERPAAAETLAADIVAAKEAELKEHSELNAAAAAADKMVSLNATALGFSLTRPVVAEQKPAEIPAKKVNPLGKHAAAFVQKTEALSKIFNAAYFDPDLKQKDEPATEVVEEKPRGDFKTKPVLILDSTEFIRVQMAADTVANSKDLPLGAAMTSLKQELAEEDIIESHRVVNEQAQAQRTISKEASDEAVKYCEVVLAYIKEIDEVQAAIKAVTTYYGPLLPAAQKPAPSVARR